MYFRGQKVRVLWTDEIHYAATIEARVKDKWKVRFDVDDTWEYMSERTITHWYVMCLSPFPLPFFSPPPP